MRPSWLNVKLPTPPNWQRQQPTHWRKPSAYRKRKTMQSSKPRYASLLFVGMLLLLSLLLSGCQKPLIPPCVVPAIPTAPVSEWSQPTQTFSNSVRQDLLKWEQRLTELAPR